MSRAALKALSRKALSIDELFETLDAFSNMPPQAEVLIGTSLIEDALKQAILHRLPMPLSNNDIASLFENDGPISSIGTRAAMASALGIIGEDTRADLHCLKDIRNAFAHARISLDFDTPEVAEACKTLTGPHRLHGGKRMTDWPPTEPRMLFRATIKLTWLHITQVAAGGPRTFDTP
jgi:DNA-binding MltR family transcriptional regulator